MSSGAEMVAEAQREMDRRVWDSITRGIALSALSLDELRALLDALGPDKPLLPHAPECRCGVCKVFVDHRASLVTSASP